MAPTRKEVAAAAGCDVDFVSNTLNRGLLTTKLAETTAGVSRDLSRPNALELAFIAALVAIGYSPTEASAVAVDWLKREKKHELPAYWVENSRTRVGALMSDAPKDIEGALVMFPDDEGSGDLAEEGVDPFSLPDDFAPATCLSIIHVAEIVRRVDRLFAE
jgi:hypothetical protein